VGGATPRGPVTAGVPAIGGAVVEVVVGVPVKSVVDVVAVEPMTGPWLEHPVREAPATIRTSGAVRARRRSLGRPVLSFIRTPCH
jgi:hypothetical protein